jgi:predicted DNA-binding protein
VPRVDVTLDDEMYRRLDDLATRRGLSLSSLVRSIIIEGLTHSDPFDRVQMLATDKGVYWVNYMRQLINERLDEIEEERKG